MVNGPAHVLWSILGDTAITEYQHPVSKLLRYITQASYVDLTTVAIGEKCDNIEILRQYGVPAGMAFFHHF